ncbi:SURF1 family protein [Variovorax sp. J22R115]|uniref:SURF1 family protein n=1 Tax=Variovorax sp. J22R115 TaxID=3053509 RepID=UPI00257605BA|nr:SURF1 family protein [Variovorax sp. J22R115]MDM0050834.1 SURF1 family protein [Variovorax sp. J22R115]
MTQPRSSAVLAALALCALLAFAGFVALGIWQVERRAWKLDLIARIDQRVHAPAVAPPATDRWPKLNAADDAYRRVRATGTFLHDSETLVQATTELGGGYWVLTPLRMTDGSIMLINRGFVPPEARDRAARGAADPEGESTVTGLLRITEPGGSFLRRNDPAADRWYSRDVQAIAAVRGLSGVAPYFVDAEAAPSRPGTGAANVPRTWPVGGLTVISFANNHLVYAFTWFALALMVAAAAWYVGRDERRVRQGRMNEDAGHD